MAKYKELPSTFFLASMLIMAVAAHAHDQDDPLPEYMSGCFHKTAPSEGVELIIGAANSAASIAGKMRTDINFTLSLMRVNKQESVILSIAENDNERTILFIKQGQAQIVMGEDSEQLNIFDTALIFNSEDQITLHGDVDNTEVYVLTLIDTYDKKDAPKPLTIARFDEQSPVNERGFAKLLSRLRIDAVNKILRALGPDELYLLSGKKEGMLQPDYALAGPDKLIFCLAKMPAGGGPALHIHRLGDEIFVVIAGTIRVTFGDDGEYQKDLDPGDVVLFPPSINRTFKNIGHDEAILLPIVRGTNKEVEEDIVFLPQEIERLKDEEDLSSLMIGLAKSIMGLQIKKRADIDFPHGDLTEH